MLAKVKFLKDGEPKGRAYTYSIAKEIEQNVEVGTTVLVGSGKGVVTEINVPEESITFSLDKLKTIDTLADVAEKEENPVTGFVTNE